MHYSVSNCATVEILLGESYELERRSGHDWVPVPLPWGFRLIGYLLSAGDRRQMDAAIPDNAPAGRYQIRKALRAAPGVEDAVNEVVPVEVTAAFDVRA